MKQIWILFLSLLCLTACHKEKGDSMCALNINFQEGDLPSLHPHDLVVHLRGLSLSKSLFEGLTRIGADGKAKLAGAASVEVSPDGLKYTFTLRDNHWSNGEPVTASHYEQAFKTALSPISTCGRANLLYILKNGEEAKKGQVPLEQVGIRALNNKTLELTLAYPSPFLFELLAQPICAPILHKEEKQVTTFNGPFLVESWERGQHLRLKPNPHFWDRAHIALKQINISMLQDISTGFAAYEQGNLHWAGAPIMPLSVEQVSYLQQQGLLRSHTADRIFWIFLNTTLPPLSSPKIRQALSMALSRTTITDHIFINGIPLSKPFPSSVLARTPAHILIEDLQRAQTLFQEGLDELGLTRDTFPGFNISFAALANRKQLAEYLCETWQKAFHIPVRLDMQEWNVLRTRLDQGQFQIAGCTEAPYYRDPIEVFERFTSKIPGNFSGWTNPQFTQIICSAKREGNFERRLDLVAEAEQILIDEMPFIPICNDRFFFTHTQGLHGYVFDSLGAIDFSYATRKAVL